MSVAFRILKSAAYTVAAYRREKTSSEWMKGFHAGLICEARCALRSFVRELPRKQQKEIGKYIREKLQQSKTP